MNITEILRLLNNLIRIGFIEQVDAEHAVCTVKTGENIIENRPWITLRAGSTKRWSPPSSGEQVVLLSPGGDLAQALVITGLFSNENPAPSNSGDEEVLSLPDGSEFRYNHNQHILSVSINGAADVSFDKATHITVKEGDCSVAVQSGNATIDANQIKLNNGAGVVTGAHLCAYTGAPHSDCSKTVFAGDAPAGE